MPEMCSAARVCWIESLRIVTFLPGPLFSGSAGAGALEGPESFFSLSRILSQLLPAALRSRFSSSPSSADSSITRVSDRIEPFCQRARAPFRARNGSLRKPAGFAIAKPSSPKAPEKIEASALSRVVGTPAAVVPPFSIALRTIESRNRNAPATPRRSSTSTTSARRLRIFMADGQHSARARRARRSRPARTPLGPELDVQRVRQADAVRIARIAHDNLVVAHAADHGRRERHREGSLAVRVELDRGHAAPGRGDVAGAALEGCAGHLRAPERDGGHVRHADLDRDREAGAGDARRAARPDQRQAADREALGEAV